MEHDWNLVAERKPKGYIELNNLEEAIYGPIESLSVDDSDFVVIKVRWSIKRKLGEHGIPPGDWEVISNVPCILVLFPNLIIPFEIEETPNKGPRVRFRSNVLYFNDVHKVYVSDVEGLHPVPV